MLYAVKFSEKMGFKKFLIQLEKELISWFGHLKKWIERGYPQGN
jgi:hypothetical protein